MENTYPQVLRKDKPFFATVKKLHEISYLCGKAKVMYSLFYDGTKLTYFQGRI